LHGDGRDFLSLKAGVRVGERVAADREIDEVVGAGVVGLRAVRVSVVWSLTMVTVVEARAPPVLSVTVPVMPPRVC